MKKVLLGSIVALTAVAAQAQNCQDIFISEYVEGTYNNKAIELYNPTSEPIDLGAGQYKFGRDRDGAGTPMLMDITGIIQPYDVRVFVLDKRDPNGTGNEVPVVDELQAKADTFVNPVYVQSDSPFYFNGDDAFVLVKGTATILDIIGKIGEDPGSGWFVPGDPNTRWWTTDNTLIRKPSIQHGVTSNPSVFDPSLEWDSLPSDVYDSLGVHYCLCGAVNIDELEKTPFDLFPNPIEEGQFVVKSPSKMVAFTIFSANGSLIREERMEKSEYQSIELPEVAPGMYTIVIQFEDGTRNYRKLIFK
ncbi:MAG: lamin tail domain-containing protein [Flavobacteriales bacterium]